MRKEEAGWPAKVKVGYGTAARTRGFHPRGLQEHLVFRASELATLDPKIHIVRISARVGERKRLMILEEVRQRNFRVANPGKSEEKPVVTEEPIPEESSSEAKRSAPVDEAEEIGKSDSSNVVEEDPIDEPVEEDEDK